MTPPITLTLETMMLHIANHQGLIFLWNFAHLNDEFIGHYNCSWSKYLQICSKRPKFKSIVWCHWREINTERPHIWLICYAVVYNADRGAIYLQKWENSFVNVHHFEGLFGYLLSKRIWIKKVSDATRMTSVLERSKRQKKYLVQIWVMVRKTWSIVFHNKIENFNKEVKDSL